MFPRADRCDQAWSPCRSKSKCAVFQAARSGLPPARSRFVILATLPRIARGPTSATLSFAPCLRGSLHQLWIGGSSHVDRSFVCDHGFAQRLALLAACEDKSNNIP
jgi:hypothetical protein